MVNVSVVDRRADGLYECKRDHWPANIFVPCVPNVEIPYPCRAQMMFEDGNAQRPFIYWPHSARRLAGGTFANQFAWSAYKSDFSQDNAREDTLQLAEETISEISSAYPFMVRENVILLREENGTLKGAWEYAHGGELLELVLDGNAYLFFAEEFSILTTGGEEVAVENPWGESSVTEVAEYDYEDYGHPGRECDPDGGIIIGGL